MIRRLLEIDVFDLDRRAALAIAFLLFAAVALTDYITTYELSLTALYLFIVLLSTWNCGWKWGLFFAVISLLPPIVTGEMMGTQFSEPEYFYIDNANRLVSFVVGAALTARLKFQHEREKHSARLDYLTGIPNSKGFYEALGVEIARHRRDMNVLSIAFLDCDDFKDVNDRFGHKEGDRLLEVLATTIRSHLRRTDIVARLGGDEFVILLTNTDNTRAASVIDKLRLELDARMKEHGWPVTFSIGLGVFPIVPGSEDQIISFTDHLMYRAKSSGKNNTVAEVYAVGDVGA